MHLSQPSIETGNARMYELAYRGIAQVVDTSKISATNEIFVPNHEVLTYETELECIEKLDALLGDDKLRINLAINAYKRAKKEYCYNKVLLDVCNWFSGLINKGINH
jgi:spore maturation protein CgeB